MKVARESSLRQCQVLHLGRCLLVSFLVGRREGREERDGRSGREEERKERKRGEEKGEEKSGMVEEDG